MQNKKRALFFILLAVFLLFLGLVFREFLLTEIVMPVATVVWLFLRIFVLSIDQLVYWWGLIFSIVILALVRLFRGPSTTKPSPQKATNPALARIAYWQAFIRLNTHESKEKDSFRRDLAWLLTSMYSSSQPGHANFEILEAFKQRQIPLPEPIYTFLFASNPVAPRPPFIKHPIDHFRHKLQSMELTRRKWMRKWSGREAAEYYQAIDEVLTLMETSLEMKNDDHPTDIDHD